MAPIASIWARIVYAFDALTGLGGFHHLADDSLQIPVLGHTNDHFQTQGKGYPIFDPPDELQPEPFRCEYPSYPASEGWEHCNNEDRTCWLRNLKTKKNFTINTDYETVTPKGIDRYYTIILSEGIRNADGHGDVFVQLFNDSFPGPRLQACWGDTLHITVKNNLTGNDTINFPGNGTAVHWHGFRQLNTFPMDGVNAITQCPIAPNDEFTYVFTATQYGTSWYHSHYSLQYAAGALGAITIYGPVSDQFDHQLEPIIVSDWLHDPVFGKWDYSIEHSSRIYIDNILQSGIGHWPPTIKGPNGNNIIPPDAKFNNLIFQKGVRYLIRLINGAADTTFVFSIDNHKFKVVSMDFVSIDPYETDHLVVGIGQRYNIIVEAKPVHFTADQNFWIRTTPSPNCTAFNSSHPVPDERTGIVRYTFDSGFPTSERNKFEPTCADETYFRNLTPVVPWTIDEKKITKLDPFYLNTNSKSSSPYWPCKKSDPTFHFELVSDNPMWLNFSHPTSLHLDDDYSKRPWLAEVNTGDVAEDHWIQLTIISGGKKNKTPLLPHPVPKKPGLFVPGQHPIHLHGHDFAVLDQCVPDGITECNVNNATLQYVHPPRRDVAFLPNEGYLIIAFKADNPGIWIMHCHIAFHASMGLATQILENRNKIKLPFGWDEPFESMCQKWDKWNPFDPSDPCMVKRPNIVPLQTDSGI